MDSVYSLRILPILRGGWGMWTEQGQEIKPGWGLRSVRDLTSCFLFILHKPILRGEAYLESCSLNTWVQPQARSQDILESDARLLSLIWSEALGARQGWSRLTTEQLFRVGVPHGTPHWEIGDLQLACLGTRWVSVGKGSGRGELLEEAAGRGRGGVGTGMAQGVWNGVPRKYGIY